MTARVLGPEVERRGPSLGATIAGTDGSSRAIASLMAPSTLASGKQGAILKDLNRCALGSNPEEENKKKGRKTKSGYRRRKGEIPKKNKIKQLGASENSEGGGKATGFHSKRLVLYKPIRDLYLT